MAQGLINSETMTAIGDAIREKTGSTSLLLPSAMPQAIKGIVSGGGFNPDNIKLYSVYNSSSYSRFVGPTDMTDDSIILLYLCSRYDTTTSTYYRTTIGGILITQLLREFGGTNHKNKEEMLINDDPKISDGLSTSTYLSNANDMRFDSGLYRASNDGHIYSHNANGANISLFGKTFMWYIP